MGRFDGLLPIEELLHSSPCQLSDGAIGAHEGTLPRRICHSHPFADLQMSILDLFFDLLNLPSPSLCDTYQAALKSTCQ